MKTVSDMNRQIIGNVYQEIRHDIYAIFRQACIVEEICDDLVQEVFMKIMGLDIIIREQLKGLAVMIAYQKRTDYLRHRAYINKVNADYGWTMERSYNDMKAEVNDILQVEMKTINGMSELDRKTYSLSRFEEKTADEMAVILHLSKRAVESRLYRTRNMVRENVRKAINF